MKVLINLSTLKVGGGQNVAMNFLIGLESGNFQGVEILFLVAENSAPDHFISASKKWQYWVTPRNPVYRILYERLFLSRIIKKSNVDIVYSYFGFGWFHPSILQVSGSADSNLYYPDIDFWQGYSKLSRIYKRIIDRYRLWGVKKSVAVVFENEALMRRGRLLYGLPEAALIKPSIMVDPESAFYSLPGCIPPQSKKILLLCGWHLNKNVMMVPEIAALLKDKGELFHFIITAPVDNSPLHVDFMDKVRKYNVETQVTVAGQVKKKYLKSLYEQIDYVLLLSKLESFSNNIIEAWQFGKPLVVAAEEWSKAICKDAAFYVNRNSASDIANALYRLSEDKELADDLVRNGAAELATYPSIRERVNTEINYLRNVLQTH